MSIALLLFGMPGCKTVRSSDLTGTWVITEASRHFLPDELQKASAKIVLDANGNFVVSDLPGLLYFPPGRPQLDSGNGVWKLVLHNDRQQIQLEFDATTAGSPIKLPFATYIEVSGGWSSLSLFYFLGDADEGRRIDFRKKQSNSDAMLD